MTFAKLLIDSCIVRRFRTGDADDYGKLARDWYDLATGQPCRLMTTTGREVLVGAEVVVADYKLFIEDTSSITEQDRIVVNDVTYEILSVMNRKDGIGVHHRELLMRTVR